MDSKLNFKYHINFLVKKMKKFCGLLYQIRDVLTTAQLIKTYFSHIQPILQPGVIVYGTANKASLQKLKMKQNLRNFLRKWTNQSVTYFKETYKIFLVKELPIYEIFKNFNLRKDLKTEFLKNSISDSEIQVLKQRS